jgi:phosphoglycerol transferase MdoB-like AlkP superfamily enzyme
MRWRVLIVVAVVLVAAGQPEGQTGGGEPPFDLEVIAHGLPLTISTGAEIPVPIEIANRGSTPWTPDDGYFLSYHWLDPSGETVVWDGRRSALPKTITSGEAVRMSAEVVAPLESGSYLLVWDVVQEGVRWISEVDPTRAERVSVSVRSSHAFAVVDGAAPRFLGRNSPVSVELRIRNDGTLGWRGDGSFAVSYRWLDGSGEQVHSQGHRVPREGRRVPIPSEVGSGETVAVVAELAAPPSAGVYRLQWDMVEEGVCWFSQRGGAGTPASRVLVVGNPLTDPRGWALLCLLASAAAVSTVATGRPRFFVRLFKSADWMWCAGALAFKQGMVLGQVDLRPTAGGWVLIAATALLIAMATRLLPPRLRGWACWSVVAVGTFGLWADAVYLRFFDDLPAVFALASIGQLGRVEASVRSLVTAADLWMWLDLLPGVVLILAADRLRGRAAVARRGSAAVVGVLVCAVVAIVGLFGVQRGLLDQVFRRVLAAREVGVVNLHLVDGLRSASARLQRGGLEPQQQQEILEWFQTTAPARAGGGPAFAAATGMNLVMVQVESLQGFVIGLEIGGQEVTPFLNRWRDEALWFSNFTDQTLSGRSSDSEFATQVSLLPSAAGASAFRFADNEFTGLAGVLAANGYQTVSAVPFEGSFWNRRVTHPSFGYQRSVFDDGFGPGESIGWGLNDRAFLGQMAGRMSTWERPFSAYLLTLSLHHPFEGFPAQHRTLDVGRWQGTPFGAFLHTMHFFDRALADFVAELERSGLAATTVIAIWGDHDAGFEWRPEIASAIGASHDAAGWYLSQEVPLFIRVPGREEIRGERLVPAGHVDVAPTLLALLGIDPAPYAYVGRNLLGLPGDGPVVGEYACWRDAHRLFLQGDGTLAGGRCLALPDLFELEVEDCAQPYAQARRAMEVSQAVLEFDLQPWLHDQLEAERGAVQ